eukprot:TRINITY_DN2137_c1_g1_i1.p1 TRINITY_DN2137_c1_g1~~TRINITY_DN2137_c1_g1_i1.p1  ORF type:complete len:1233 (+),score=386.64 TRINITY_DN2137_c1_g1_i1:63-3761(+)
MEDPFLEPDFDETVDEENFVHLSTDEPKVVNVFDWFIALARLVERLLAGEGSTVEICVVASVFVGTFVWLLTIWLWDNFHRHVYVTISEKKICQYDVVRAQISGTIFEADRFYVTDPSKTTTILKEDMKKHTPVDPIVKDVRCISVGSQIATVIYHVRSLFMPWKKIEKCVRYEFYVHPCQLILSTKQSELYWKEDIDFTAITINKLKEEEVQIVLAKHDEGRKFKIGDMFSKCDSDVIQKFSTDNEICQANVTMSTPFPGVYHALLVRNIQTRKRKVGPAVVAIVENPIICLPPELKLPNLPRKRVMWNTPNLEVKSSKGYTTDCIVRTRISEDEEDIEIDRFSFENNSTAITFAKGLDIPGLYRLGYLIDGDMSKCVAMLDFAVDGPEVTVAKQYASVFWNEPIKINVKTSTHQEINRFWSKKIDSLEMVERCADGSEISVGTIELSNIASNTYEPNGIVEREFALPERMLPSHPGFYFVRLSNSLNGSLLTAESNLIEVKFPKIKKVETVGSHFWLDDISVEIHGSRKPTSQDNLCLCPVGNPMVLMKLQVPEPGQSRVTNITFGSHGASPGWYCIEYRSGKELFTRTSPFYLSGPELKLELMGNNALNVHYKTSHSRGAYDYIHFAKLQNAEIANKKIQRHVEEVKGFVHFEPKEMPCESGCYELVYRTNWGLMSRGDELSRIGQLRVMGKDNIKQERSRNMIPTEAEVLKDNPAFVSTSAPSLADFTAMFPPKSIYWHKSTITITKSKMIMAIPASNPNGNNASVVMGGRLSPASADNSLPSAPPLPSKLPNFLPPPPLAGPGKLPPPPAPGMPPAPKKPVNTEFAEEDLRKFWKMKNIWKHNPNREQQLLAKMQENGFDEGQAGRLYAAIMSPDCDFSGSAATTPAVPPPVPPAVPEKAPINLMAAIRNAGGASGLKKKANRPKPQPKPVEAPSKPAGGGGLRITPELIAQRRKDMKKTVRPSPKTNDAPKPTSSSSGPMGITPDLLAARLGNMKKPSPAPKNTDKEFKTESKPAWMGAQLHKPKSKEAEVEPVSEEKVVEQKPTPIVPFEPIPKPQAIQPPVVAPIVETITECSSESLVLYRRFAKILPLQPLAARIVQDGELSLDVAMIVAQKLIDEKNNPVSNNMVSPVTEDNEGSPFESPAAEDNKASPFARKSEELISPNNTNSRLPIESKKNSDDSDDDDEEENVRHKKSAFRMRFSKIKRPRNFESNSDDEDDESEFSD